MKHFLISGFLVFVLFALYGPGLATKRMPSPATSVDLSAVADSPYTEVLRIATQPAYYSDQADVVLLRIKATGLTGGTETLIRVCPAWALADTSIDGDPLALCYPDLIDSLVVSLAGTREVIVGVKWGRSSLFLGDTYHVLPPYLSVELQENRTGGTITIEPMLLHH